MIPSWKSFGDVTFADLSLPENRRDRALACLEKFEFPILHEAFVRGGCWKRVERQTLIHALSYKLGEFCANTKIHTCEIAVESWTELQIYGVDKEQATERAMNLTDFLDDTEHDQGGSNSFDLFNDYQLFDQYQNYYGNQNYQKWETVHLVFARTEIMEHMRQTEISPIGWALWKYAINEGMLFGLHPSWAFERARQAMTLGNITQGSGYEYIVRVLPDPHASAHVTLTHPAFMFLDQEDALKFRTTLDMLGFYDEQSQRYEPLQPVPIFSQSTSGTAYRPSIRAANFVVM